jgi:hypothetical protein
MNSDENGISLEGKMDDWGPFGNSEGKWLLFSMGNPEEGHSYALPRNMDDLGAQRITHLISCKTGGRYVAHIPWSTDTAGLIAKDWSPKTIPPRELINRLVKFLQYHIQLYEEMGFDTSRVFIYSFHGGNNPIAGFIQEIKEKLNLNKLIITRTDNVAGDIADIVLEKLHFLSIELSKDNIDAKKLMRKLIKIVTTLDHAGHCEHSIGAAIGVLDEEKLVLMNRELEDDFEKALKKWPTLAGLGGLIMYGKKYAEVLGTKDNDIHGHWKCLNTLRRLDNGKIVTIKEVGVILIETIVNYYSQIIKENTL